MTPPSASRELSRLPFLEELDRSQVLLLDGGIGTELYNRGFFLNQCYDALNLSAPDVVREIHEAYATSGARVLTTNTFGSTRPKLTKHGAESDLEQISVRGAQLAREAIGPGGYVAGSVGPLGMRLEPWGPTSLEEAREIFAEQMRALAKGGVDLFILETFSDLSALQQAILAAREVAPDLPLIASVTVDNDSNSLYGTTPEVFTSRLDEWGADIIGLNCSVGPGPMLSALERMVGVTNRPLAVQPNAGLPRLHEGRQIYLAGAEYMAEYAKRFVQTGARLVGGCCGTTPEYIRAMRNALRMLVPGTRTTISAKAPARFETAGPVISETTVAERSPLGQRLAEGLFPVSVELTPPRGWQSDKVLESAKALYEAGVDCINVPDGPRATSRMSNQALCLLIHQHIGIEVLPHYCCRDRNLLGMMSDILGLAGVGLHNILLITGDPPKMGDYPDATAVFDVDAIGLTNMVHSFNRGRDIGGNRIDPPTHFVIGVGCNPGAIDLDTEVDRFKWKVDAGADFAITQPVFDTRLLLEFLPKVQGYEIPILAGIWPLTSLRNAEFMNSEVPGASVPEGLMKRMAAAQEQGRDAARREGLEIARDAVREIHDVVAGLQVSAPFGRIAYALDVLEVLSELPVRRAQPITNKPR